VQVANGLRNLEDDVSRKILAKVCQLYDLVEQFTAFHDCNVQGIRYGKIQENIGLSLTF
jgi:hypothetical protein